MRARIVERAHFIADAEEGDEATLLDLDGEAVPTARKVRELCNDAPGHARSVRYPLPMIHRALGPLMPWDGGPDIERVVFCALWTTGPDTLLDGVFRFLALRPEKGGGWEVFDRWCKPFDGQSEADSAATARMAREYGVTQRDLEQAEPTAEAFAAFRTFLGDAPVVTLEGHVFENWFEHLAGAKDSAPDCVGLAEVAALLFPGRLANLRDDLALALLPSDAHDGPPRALEPTHVQRALAQLVSRFHAQGDDVMKLAACGFAKVWEGLVAPEPSAARRLAFALALVEHPTGWSRSTGELFSAGTNLQEGRLGSAYVGDSSAQTWLDDLMPKCAKLGERWQKQKPLPPSSEDPVLLDASDMTLLDDLFQVHLPALFALERGGEASDHYRESQHSVAREVARTLGSDELLLVHAPTGTGKTLAYLLPALLWARRGAMRVGIATYTRALQEQAMDREVPRALAALARAGVDTGFRACVLKGRENYVCWRALRLAAPGADEGAEVWLAWTALALFTVSDADGDLNRFPRRSPLGLMDERRFRRIQMGLVRQTRSRSGCCTHAEDRSTCAAEVARRRAERSHVVITNQSFALSRQEFFRHMIFDECEHLHEQAHNAWSYSLTFDAARKTLGRIHQPTGSTRAPLDRLDDRVVVGSPSHETLVHCRLAWEQHMSAFDALERAVDDFDAWRSRVRRERDPGDEHSLLREYVNEGEAAALIAARQLVTASGNELDGRLAEVAERIDQVPVRGGPRIRRSLELARGELIDMLSAVESWLPLAEGIPKFRSETFYDVEVDMRGRKVLAARVLLPNEYLGRNYYPALASGVFLSATTHLGGSFDAARGYLGLDRAESPPEEEVREGRKVRTFFAPEVFDYSRVLVAAPRDVPHPSQEKAEFLAYVRRFISWLGERTRGRMLVLFTNLADVRQVGAELEGFFRARKIPLYYQGMEGTEKEELSDLFRANVDSILLGVDTFWYGADFPGETLEYLVIVKLPYGVPDTYHHAQRAALGTGHQRSRIYMPRALAKFRQGFGRLMRRRTDKGTVFLLDKRLHDPRHRSFLKELPTGEEDGARFVRGDTDHCAHEALAHMGMLADVRRRGLTDTFREESAPREEVDDWIPRPAPTDTPSRPTRPEPPTIIDIPSEDLPF